MSELSASEVADLFVRQIRLPSGEWPAQLEEEPHAITVWEKWICEDPERAWPVFSEILERRRDDMTLYQVGVRLRLMLWRYYDAYIERARSLFDVAPRLWRIMGDDALDRRSYTEEPYDRDKLIAVYEHYYRYSRHSFHLGKIAESSTGRAVAIVIEMIHRAPKYGIETSRANDPLIDLLRSNAEQVIELIVAAATESVLLRRALWDVAQRRQWSRLPAEISDRCAAAAGETTEYTDDFAPWPLPRRQDAQDEMLIEAWLEAERTFWAWSEVADMVDEDADEAWEVTRRVIERCDDERTLFVHAAGPLEDLIQKHPEKFDEIAAAARSNPNIRRALAGVWMYPEYEAYSRFRDLLAELKIEPE